MSEPLFTLQNGETLVIRREVVLDLVTGERSVRVVSAELRVGDDEERPPVP